MGRLHWRVSVVVETFQVGEDAHDDTRGGTTWQRHAQGSKELCALKSGLLGRTADQMPFLIETAREHLAKSAILVLSVLLQCTHDHSDDGADDARHSVQVVDPARIFHAKTSSAALASRSSSPERIHHHTRRQ